MWTCIKIGTIPETGEPIFCWMVVEDAIAYLTALSANKSD